MRIGIIGAGQMGGYYAENLVGKLDFPASSVIVKDIQNEKAVTLAQRYGLVASTAPLSQDKMDAAIVAVNTPAHADVIIGLLKNGVRRILVEKPLGLNTRDTQKILAYLSPDDMLYEALVINYSVALSALQTLMEGKGVEPLELYGNWGKPRPLDKVARPSPGDVEDETLHMISFAMKLLRKKLAMVHVTARVGHLRFVDPPVQERAQILDRSFPLVPNSSTAALIRFGHGVDNTVPFDCRSSFLLARQVREVGGVLGKDGEPAYLFSVEFDVKTDKGVEDRLTVVDLAQKTSSPMNFGGDKLLQVTQAFLEAAEGKKPDPRLATAAEGALLVKITEAILNSARNGRSQTITVN